MDRNDERQLIKNLSEQKDAITRRQFSKVVAAFGLTAAVSGLLAACSSPSQQNVESEAQKASGDESAKAGKADFNIVYAMDGVMNRWPDSEIIEASLWLIGYMQFKELIESKSNGKIHVEFHGDGALGSQTELATKVRQGVITMGTCSSQNVSGIIPIWNVLDVPYGIGTLENIWKVLYSKDVHKHLREPSMEQGIMHCFGLPTLRRLQVRKGIDIIKKPEDIEGLKIRVTNSKFEQKAFDKLPGSPTPIDWAELYTSFNSGAVDASFVSDASIVDANIHEALGQLVDINFMSSIDSTWMNPKEFRKYPKDLQEAFHESIMETQSYIHENHEDLFVNMVGDRKESPDDVGYKGAGVELVFLTDSERKAWEDIIGYEANKQEYDSMINEYGKKAYDAVMDAVVNGSPEPAAWWK